MRYLTKLKDKKNIKKLKEKFFVFDVETTKLEPMEKNFVFGVIYGWNFSKVIYSVEDFKKEFQKKNMKISTYLRTMRSLIYLLFSVIFMNILTTKQYSTANLSQLN